MAESGWSLKDIELNGELEYSQALTRLRRMMEGGERGFWEWDLVANKMYWFGSLWQTMGYSNEERPDDPEAIFDYYHPDDRERVREALRDAAINFSILELRYRVRAKNGEYWWIQAYGQSYRDSENRTICVSGSNIDISEVKRKEQEVIEAKLKFDRIIAGTNDGIWEWNLETDEVEFSAVCWEQLGYFKEDFDGLIEGDRATHSDWLRCMVEEDAEAYINQVRDLIHKRTPIDVEYRVRGKDGLLVWLRSRAQATLIKNGRVVTISGSNMNITELKKTQAALIETKDSAEKANQAKSEFLSSMSHELRTPLNAILGYAQLLDYDEHASCEQKENVGEIRKAGSHLLQLINDILDLAQVEAGKMNMSIEAVVTNRVIDDCFTLMQPLARAENIDLYRHSDELGDVPISADNTRLKQAIINLMSNGIKYNRPGGSVMLSVKRISNNRIRISVIDTGHGIAEEKHKAVFEAFNRLNAGQSQIQGSGVGLAVTKKLVEMMHGEIGFDSELGVGTTFWIDLPIMTLGNSDKLAEEEPDVDPLSLALAFEDECSILYIEDNPINIKVLSGLIKHYSNLTLSSALEPMQGLYKARTEKPDIILLDINLPHMSGFEVYKVLSRDECTKDIPVVALSANAMSFEIEKGLQTGFQAYLTKPIDMGKFVSTVNTCFLEAKKPSITPSL
ncbi:MAG: hybrid sensor histidine kinase/response regulator [Alteromonadaceae bacterium]|nr:MAG: hybrid sensor histidine kinase/response regulator [Alteromonadaceae bacterium]